jgi:hypothetical protein
MRDRIIAGDTLDFVTTLPDYPASGGYTLKYRLAPRSSGSAIDITCTADGDDHRCGAAASVTATWAAGEYSWSCWVEKGAERYSGTAYPWRGECTILPNPATTATYDARTPARKALDAINAALATYAERAHVIEYEIGGRRMKFADQGALLVMRQRLAAEVAAEDIQAKLAAGLGGGRKLQIRL